MITIAVVAIAIMLGIVALGYFPQRHLEPVPSPAPSATAQPVQADEQTDDEQATPAPTDTDPSQADPAQADPSQEQPAPAPSPTENSDDQGSP